jgi:hypothetical protein
MGALRLAALVLIGTAAAIPARAQDSHWGAPDDPTVKAIVASEAMWASAVCGPQPGLKDFIADDFQGTATNGSRYDKAQAVGTDVKDLHRDCKLGEVKVRFFGDAIALVYGAESNIRKDKDGRDEQRCLAWTDTWLKRGGKWQIVAAQDNVVKCP